MIAPEQILVPCPECEGSGEPYDGVTCSECDGTGRVEVEAAPITLKDLDEACGS